MTTVSRTFTWTNNSSTLMNACIVEFYTMLNNAGLVLTSDTGQLSATTPGVTYAATNSLLYGYHVFKFPDTLQSTTPIFLKVTYSNHSLQASGTFAPVFGISVAGSTDGAGNLTTTAGPIFGPYSLQVASSMAASRVSYCCYTDGTFNMFIAKDAVTGYSINNCLAVLTIDRTRNSTGDAQAGGYLVGGPTAWGTAHSWQHWFGPTTIATVTSQPYFIPNSSMTYSVEGTTINMFRPYMMTPGVHPSLGFLAYFKTEIGDITSQTLTVAGSSHTYLPLVSLMPQGGTAISGAIRWE